MKKIYDSWEEFNSDQSCSAWVATAIVGSSIVGAGASIYSSSKAAQTQAQAAQTAAGAQVEASRQANQRLQQQYETTRSDLSPYRQLGQTAVDQLTGRLVDLTTGIPLPELQKEMTQEELEKTPGYQFTLTQGLKATQNSAAARGLGVSGAALKGAATFATGLSDQTYNTRFGQETELYKQRQQQFTNQQTNQQNAYNRLKGLVDTGSQAAGQTGQIGTNIAQQEASNTIGSGQAQAAGYMNAAQSQAAGYTTAGGAVSQAAGNVGGYLAYKGIYGDAKPNQAPAIPWKIG